MDFEYILSKQDYIDFNVFHISYSDSMRRSVFIQRYIPPIGFLILPFILILVTTIPLWYWLTVFVFTSILWIAFYQKYIERSISKRISKMLDEGENEGKGILGKHKFSFSKEGIVDICEHSELKTKLNAIENIVEAKEHIFIYISPVSAFIIPNRVFESGAHKRDFLEMLSETRAK